MGRKLSWRELVLLLQLSFFIWSPVFGTQPSMILSTRSKMSRLEKHFSWQSKIFKTVCRSFDGSKVHRLVRNSHSLARRITDVTSWQSAEKRCPRRPHERSRASSCIIVADFDGCFQWYLCKGTEALLFFILVKNRLVEFKWKTNLKLSQQGLKSLFLS